MKAKWERAENKLDRNLHWLEKRVRNFDLDDYDTYDMIITNSTKVIWEPVFTCKQSIFNVLWILWRKPSEQVEAN